MARLESFRLSFITSFSSALLLGFTAPAFAWDVAIGTGALDITLYVGSATGSFPTWETIDQRVRASDVPGPTIPNNWMVQAWDPIAGEWPTDPFEDFEGITQASIYNDDVTNEFWNSAEAFVFGAVSSGDAAGSGVGYDFELTLAPFTSATVVLDMFETYVYMESEPGDVGTAFTRAKLFRTDVGIDDPGGANMPLADDLYMLTAGDPPVDAQPSFSAPFSNGTPVPITYPLRFETTASVFAVPEPALGASIVLGAVAIAGLGRRRRV